MKSKNDNIELKFYNNLLIIYYESKEQKFKFVNKLHINRNYFSSITIETNIIVIYIIDSFRVIFKIFKWSNLFTYISFILSLIFHCFL